MANGINNKPEPVAVRIFFLTENSTMDFGSKGSLKSWADLSTQMEFYMKGILKMDRDTEKGFKSIYKATNSSVISSTI